MGNLKNAIKYNNSFNNSADIGGAPLRKELPQNCFASQTQSIHATDVTVPKSEIVFMSQMIIILFLLSFCTYKLSLTQLSCEEKSLWFSLLSGLIGYVLANPRLLRKLLIRRQDCLWQL